MTSSIESELRPRRTPTGRTLAALRGAGTASPVVLLTLAAIVLFAFLEPRFLSAYNIWNVLEQTSALGLMAIGLAVVLLLGGIDLSIPAVMASAAVVGATVMVATQNPWLGPPVMIGVGMACGLLNGIAVGVLGLVPFAVTLATLTLAGGFAVWMTDGTSIYGMPYQFSSNVMMRLGDLPLAVAAFLGFVALTHWAVRSSLIGRWLYAVGTNRRAARVVDMPIRLVELGAYVFAGLTAGLAAILLTARIDSAAASMGSESVVLDVVAAAVIGGVSIYGGRGTLLGAAIGALFIVIVGNGLNLLGFDYFTAIVVKGTIILAAIALDAALTRRARASA